MNVVDLPQFIPREWYAEAIERYVDRVTARSVAVYQVGNVRFPGLSDIDLLVIPKRASVANRHSFSARQRLPRKYLPLFLHEPFILPRESAELIENTTLRPVLLSGEDVLAGYRRIENPDEQWCRLLEAYCSYAAFRQRVESSGVLPGRLTVAVASALRFTLAQIDALFGTAKVPAYAEQADALRARFFERADARRGVLDLWELLHAGLAGVEDCLRDVLRLSSQEEPIAAVQHLLSGAKSDPHIDRAYVARRTARVYEYHRRLAALGFPYGHVFFVAGYPEAVRLSAPASPSARFALAVHRMWGRLDRYARA